MEKASSRTVPRVFHEDDYVTGERLSGFADVSLYERQYVERFPALRQYARHIVYLNEPLESGSASHALLRTSRVFFTRVDWLSYFVETVLPVVETEVILITHMSDMTSGMHEALVGSTKLAKWYGCNMRPSHKTEALPLGLENPGMWNRTDFHQIYRASSTAKTELLHVYFDVMTNKPVRAGVLRALNRNGFKMNPKRSWDRYIEELSRHKYCACPRGNGIDTHRVWECLYLGVVPVVERVPELYIWYKDLPILWVESFTMVTVEFLHDNYDSVRQKQQHSLLRSTASMRFLRKTILRRAQRLY